MTQHLFLQFVSNKWEQKHRVSETFYINSDKTNIIKVYKDYVEFDAEQAENTKS